MSPVRLCDLLNPPPCVQEYQEVVGGSTTKPAAAHARVGMAAEVASNCWGGCYRGDSAPPAPDPPGRVAADRSDTPPGVQQGEIHGAGCSDLRGGERKMCHHVYTHLKDPLINTETVWMKRREQVDLQCVSLCV